MEVCVKRATAVDINEVGRLFDAYRVFYKQATDINLAINFIAERINNDESVIFYAISSNGNYLGFTQLFPSFSSVSVKRLWILNDLYVLPEARRSGVAKKLMAAAKAFAAETNAKGVSLSTAADNLNAQALYESLDYQKDTVFYNYFLDTTAS